MKASRSTVHTCIMLLDMLEKFNSISKMYIYMVAIVNKVCS